MSDGPVVYRRDCRTARKNHRCCECYSTITRGERYHVFTGLWDDWSEFKTCDVCDTIRDDVDAARDRHDELLCFGELREAIFEGRDQERMIKFIDNMIYRGNVVPDWMFERVTSKNKQTQLGLRMILRK